MVPVNQLFSVSDGLSNRARCRASGSSVISEVTVSNRGLLPSALPEGMGAALCVWGREPFFPLDPE